MENRVEEEKRKVPVIEMDGLEHQAHFPDFATRCGTLYIPETMNCAGLPASDWIVWVQLPGLQTLVRDK